MLLNKVQINETLKSFLYNNNNIVYTNKNEIVANKLDIILSEYLNNLKKIHKKLLYYNGYNINTKNTINSSSINNDVLPYNLY